MASIPTFTDSQLQAICDVIAATKDGLSNSEIDQVLDRCNIEDSGVTANKRTRLFESLRQRQQLDRCGNTVMAFVQTAMEPVLWIDWEVRYEQTRIELNKRLAFCGYDLGQDGKIRQSKPVSTIPEAERRASRLHATLRDRSVHPEVLKFCRAELLADNYFHAVLEATKSLAGRLRGLSGCEGDGAKLVDAVLGLGQDGIPIVAFNTLTSDTDRSEHTGVMNLLKGIFGAFRNPTAHEPKISWPMSEQDALDILTLVSLLHRRLDGAMATGKGTKF